MLKQARAGMAARLASPARTRVIVLWITEAVSVVVVLAVVYNMAVHGQPPAWLLVLFFGLGVLCAAQEIMILRILRDRTPPSG